MNPLLSDDRFTLPALPAGDFEVEHGKSSTTVPFRVENNIVLVPVRLNGQGPYWADFDSGSGLVLQPAVASQLKLEDMYQHKAYGGGEGSVISGRAIVETLEIGDVRLTRQPASVFGFYEDKPEMILVGSEILQRFAVHLDFDKMLLTLILSIVLFIKAPVPSFHFISRITSRKSTARWTVLRGPLPLTPAIMDRFFS